MNYFTNFPVINYFDSQTRNIILKAAFIAKIFNDTDTFYPYIIKDNERPDNIAFNEYNDATLDWVVYFSNNIIDPYYSLPLDYENFLNYLRKKYNAAPFELQGVIDHYEYTGVSGDTVEDIARKNYPMTVETYNSILLYGTYERDYRTAGSVSPYYNSGTQRYAPLAGWTSVDIFTNEQRINESKRSIKLLSKYYIDQLKKEILTIFNA
jgi:hypothetical protein